MGLEKVKTTIRGKTYVSKLIRESYRGNGNIREYGGSAAFISLAREIGLTKEICSTQTKWRGNVLAMIVGRILYKGSKLSLVNQYMGTALWELVGHDRDVRSDVDRDCYSPMDELLNCNRRFWV